MKIIQLTDPHIGGDEQDTHGVDTRENLRRMITAIKAAHPDVIVLTGDLCFKEPRRDVYEWIINTFNELDVDPLIVPGNHDDTQLLCDVFELKARDGEYYYDLTWGDTTAIFLDNSKASMSDSQWKWFEEKLNSAKRALIFAHYPPIKCYVPYMDGKYAFSQSERFVDLARSYTGELHLFCGHYHVDKSVSLDNLHVHITPSGFFQIRDDIEDFGVDHYRVGYRVIKLEEDILVHSVKYL